VGVGARHALFPVSPTLGASWAAGSPTLFSTANGVCGLAAGPSGASRQPELLSAASWPAWTGGCAAGPRTGSRHACERRSRLNRLAPGRPPHGGGALARGDGSGHLPLRLPSAHRPAVPSGIAGVAEVISAPCPDAWTSRIPCSLCPAFAGFRRAGHKFWGVIPARVTGPVLVRSSSRAPHG
jgi:hypothetical protein